MKSVNLRKSWNYSCDDLKSDGISKAIFGNAHEIPTQIKYKKKKHRIERQHLLNHQIRFRIDVWLCKTSFMQIIRIHNLYVCGVKRQRRESDALHIRFANSRETLIEKLYAKPISASVSPLQHHFARSARNWYSEQQFKSVLQNRSQKWTLVHFDCILNALKLERESSEMNWLATESAKKNQINRPHIKTGAEKPSK